MTSRMYRSIEEIKNLWDQNRITDITLNFLSEDIELKDYVFMRMLEVSPNEQMVDIKICGKTKHATIYS